MDGHYSGIFGRIETYVRSLLIPFMPLSQYMVIRLWSDRRSLLVEVKSR